MCSCDLQIPVQRSQPAILVLTDADKRQDVTCTLTDGKRAHLHAAVRTGVGQGGGRWKHNKGKGTTYGVFITAAEGISNKDSVRDVMQGTYWCMATLTVFSVTVSLPLLFQLRFWSDLRILHVHQDYTFFS